MLALPLKLALEMRNGFGSCSSAKPLSPPKDAEVPSDHRVVAFVTLHF